MWTFVLKTAHCTKQQTSLYKGIKTFSPHVSQTGLSRVKFKPRVRVQFTDQNLERQ